MFYYAAGSLRVRPQECLHIGDSYADDVIGAKGGMLACWFNPGRQSTPESESIRADFIISRLEEVPRLLN
ncbi:MAG: HAD family hydrolase [Chloroflexi bacterium]|nr:HAD family hydrolase [Chloroflexota bacterium]